MAARSTGGALGHGRYDAGRREPDPDGRYPDQSGITELSRAPQPEHLKGRAMMAGNEFSSEARTSSQTSVLQLWHRVQLTTTPVTPIAFRWATVGGGSGLARFCIWRALADSAGEE